MKKISQYSLRKVIVERQFAAVQQAEDGLRRRHAFRSELHVILGYARLITDHSNALTDQDIADAIHTAGLRLLAIVDECAAGLPAPQAGPRAAN